ncbi:DUF3991 domain-containing protein (plasmid) [Carnobacterium maltaromaticum]
MAKNHKERVKVLEEAEKKDIVDVAQSLGMGLIKQGNNYLWDEHDSFVFNTRKNLFYWNSRQKGGGPIQLVQIVKECSRPEAIEYLNNMELGTFEAIQETKKAPFHYYMKEHKKIQVSMDYLMNDRKLSKETIQFFISQGVLAQSTYKDKESGHTEPVIVFKHKDLEGNVKGISLQGIWKNHELHGKRGRLKKTYGNGFYGMSVPVGNFNKNTPTSETPLRIIAFESPIDLMSYYELYKDTIGDALLVSMNGLRKGTLSTYIANQMGVLIKEEEKPDYLDKLQNLGAKTDKIHISLAVDNDEAGKLFVDGFGIDFLPVQQELPMLLEGKEKSDWNDLLKESKSGKEIPEELKGDIKKKMDIHASSEDQPITDSIEIKKEEQMESKNTEPASAVSMSEEKSEVEKDRILDADLVSKYENLPLEEQVYLSEDTLFEGLESADIWQVVEDVKLGEILVDDLEVDTRFLYDFINQTNEEKINVFKQLLTVGSSESDAVSDYFDEKLELKQELEATKEISQTDPLTEATEKNPEPLLITENGWENKMEEQEKNSGLAQLNRSMYLVDFKQAIEEVVLEMEKKEEGTSEYLTKAEVEETLDAHLTKVEQIVSHFTTSYSLMEDPTDEEKTSLLKGLLDTIAAAVREFKAELIQKLTTKKNTVIYNVQDKTDNLRLSVKNSVNNRILKATEPIKKLVGKIDVKFALEEKIVRPNPNEKQEVTVSSGEEKLVVEELVEAEVVAEKKTEAPKVGEANLVELVREYTKLVEEKKELSDSIYKAIKNDPLAKLEEVQAKLINNQQLVEDIKEKIIAKSPLKSERETKEQEQAAIEKLANLVKQKDQLTAERNQLVEKPDFLRSSLAEKTATSSLDQFKKIDQKIDAIDNEIESIEQGLVPIVEAAAEFQVEQVVEPVVEPEEIPNPNDPFVLATAAEEKNVTPEAVKEITATTKQEKSFQEIIESKDYKSLTSNLTAGVKDLLNVESLKNYLDSVDKFHTYSPNNVQLIMKQDPDAVQVASQNKWEKLGFGINPDAKEILVYAPDINPVVDGQGQPISDDKGKPKTTVDFYLKPVYDISQTTAGTETIQSDIQIERKEDFSNVYHALVGSSKASTVGIGSIAGNDNGHYNPTDNSITIRQGLGQEQTLKTIIQESAQLALQANPNEKQGVKDPLLKNFEVESVAYIVSNHVGMDTTNYSFDYLPSLKEKNHQAKEIGKSLDTISKVASGMITEIDKNLVQSKQVSTPKNKFEDRVAKANTENKKLVSEAKNQEQTQEMKENSVAKRM